MIKIFLFSLFFIFNSAASIKKSDAVFLIENGNSDPNMDIILEVVAVGMAKLIIANSYNKIHWLVDKEANKSKFLSRMQTQKNSGNLFDLFILTHGGMNAIIANGGNIRDSDLLSLARYSNLKTVYQMNCYGDTLSDEFLTIGAKATLGRSVTGKGSDGINYPYDYPFFLHNYRLQTYQAWAVVNRRLTLVTIDSSKTVKKAHDDSINTLVVISRLITSLGLSQLLNGIIPSDMRNGFSLDFSEEEVRRATKAVRGNLNTKVSKI